MEIVRLKSEKTYCKLDRCLDFVSVTNLSNLDYEEDGEGGEDGGDWKGVETLLNQNQIKVG